MSDVWPEITGDGVTLKGCVMSGNETVRVNEVVAIEPGVGTGDIIHVTADGRRWQPCGYDCNWTGHEHGHLAADGRVIIE